MLVATVAVASGCGNPGSAGDLVYCGQNPADTAAVSEFAAGSEILLPVGSFERTEARTWEPAGSVASEAGLIFVSGVDGGFVEPVDGIYERTANRFAKVGLHSVFVKYRDPGVLGPSVNDAMAAAKYLRSRGVKRMAILGWSFGGAVITNSAVRIPEVRTVVGFAPQSRETEAVGDFSQQSILLFHSDEDENVPFYASEQILAEVPEGVKKEFHPIYGADHLLTGRADEIDPIVNEWLGRELELDSAYIRDCMTVQ